MEHLVITTKCNDNCVTCVNNFTDRKAIHSYEGYRMIEDEIACNQHISIGGGEPTLHPDFFKILNLVNGMGKEFTLLTNARSFSSDSMFERMQSLGLDKERMRIATTFYGYDARTHDSVTRSPGGFVQKVKALERLIDNGYKVELRIVISKLNYVWLEDIAGFIIGNFKRLERVVFVGMKLTGEALKNKNITLIPYNETVSHMLPAVDALSKEGHVVYILHYPHCILPKDYWQYTRGITIDESQIIFPECCTGCKQKQACSGIWKSYHDVMGGREFKAIR